METNYLMWDSKKLPVPSEDIYKQTLMPPIPTFSMIEDPSNVPPEEKWPNVDPELIRKYIREDNKYNPQFKGVWYRYKEIDDPRAIAYWRLEDEDGFAMIFSANHYRLDQCFDKFFVTKETDPDWNYGKKHKLWEQTKNQNNDRK